MMEKKLKALKLAFEKAKDVFAETSQLHIEYVVVTDTDVGWRFNVGVPAVNHFPDLDPEVLQVMDMAFERAVEIFKLHGELNVEFLTYKGVGEEEDFWELLVDEFGGESGDNLSSSFDLGSL